MIEECADCGSTKIENKELMLCASCSAARRKAERKSKQVKVVAPVKKITAKRAGQERKYAKLRREYLEAFPCCEVTDCNNRSKEVHHVAGRYGDRLTDTNNFLAVCLACHHRITVDGAWAISQGYSISRITTRGTAEKTEQINI